MERSLSHGSRSRCPELPVGDSSVRLSVSSTTGSRFELSVPLEETVQGLKRRLSDRLRVPGERLLLLHRDQRLNSGKLQDLGVVDGSRLTLMPAVEAGLMSQSGRSEQSVLQALESLTDAQVDDFLSGRSPLTLALRVCDHVMFVQLQLAAPGVSRVRAGPEHTQRTETPRSLQRQRDVCETRLTPPTPTAHSCETRLTPPTPTAHSCETRLTPPTPHAHSCETRLAPPTPHAHSCETRLTPPTPHAHSCETHLARCQRCQSQVSTPHTSHAHQSCQSPAPAPPTTQSHSSQSHTSIPPVSHSHLTHIHNSSVPPTPHSHHTHSCQSPAPYPTTSQSHHTHSCQSPAPPHIQVERSCKPGAVIESLVSPAPGVFSGTFSGSLHPQCQDGSGRPRRSVHTILQILNDLLSATRHYSPAATLTPGSPAAPCSPAAAPSLPAAALTPGSPAAPCSPAAAPSLPAAALTTGSPAAPCSPAAAPSSTAVALTPGLPAAPCSPAAAPSSPAAALTPGPPAAPCSPAAAPSSPAAALTPGSPAAPCSSAAALTPGAPAAPCSPALTPCSPAAPPATPPSERAQQRRPSGECVRQMEERAMRCRVQQVRLLLHQRRVRRRLRRHTRGPYPHSGPLQMLELQTDLTA